MAELLAGTNSGSSNAGVVVTFGSATLGPSFEVNSLDAEQVDICPHVLFSFSIFHIALC